MSKNRRTRASFGYSVPPPIQINTTAITPREYTIAIRQFSNSSTQQESREKNSHSPTSGFEKTFIKLRGFIGGKEKEQKEMETTLELILTSIKTLNPPHQLIDIFRFHNFILLPQFNDIQFIDPRIYVWRTEKRRRYILGELCYRALSKIFTTSEMIEMIFGKDNMTNPICTTFLDTVVTNAVHVFEPYDDPSFSEEGKITHISPQKMFECALDKHDKQGMFETFVTGWKFFMSVEDVSRKCIEEKQKELELLEKGEKMTQFQVERKSRLERLVCCFSEFVDKFPGEIGSAMMKYFATEDSTEVMKNSVIRAVKGAQKEEEKSLLHTSYPFLPELKSPEKASFKKRSLSGNKKTEKVMSASSSPISSVQNSPRQRPCSDEMVQDVNYDNFVLLDPYLTARQMIYYNREMLNNVSLAEFFDYKNSKAYEKYMKRLNSLTNVLDKIKLVSKAFEIFINIASSAMELNDFTVSYLVYKFIKDKLQLLELKLDKVIKKDFDELDFTFSCVKNYYNYRTKFQTICTTTAPRMPLLFVWENDMDALSNASHVDQVGQIDLNQLKSQIDLVGIIDAAKTIPYSIDQNVSFQFFFHSNYF
ncbi:hypothetical protein EIN_229740 [Entamoeba invadens IP1]|uniref:Ras-GEF domain-containing protein n=1 Tax=Entamoeba invadens IP1 TaxID=370355 RepID=A0A0A1U301_ENTIV|nr:hypothetical protein EIN_229740 [Entamoeba invadens IP1]ELP88441.1 hypothetical protein EIN_229740 [Entamoeba invadens IP1]|eukprot:XP_004255212.1 hypothetical protein EIN_229740 [Entamoeba invadens IP1]